MISTDMNTYCMAIKEEVSSDASPPVFGVAFVDTSTAEFCISSIRDDVDRTQFETLIYQLKPKEVVLEKVCMPF
jgi:DNA mismatch repair protein MSH6